MATQVDKNKNNRGVFSAAFTRNANEFEQLLLNNTIDIRLVVLDFEIYDALLDHASEDDTKQNSVT